MNNIEIVELDKRSYALFMDVKNTFSSSINENITAKASGVPQRILDGEIPINIVFAGQYSAGKSSILSLLTGQKLDIGGGITTQQCRELEWDGIHVTDTPGIHTQNIPDHDQITYNAIAKADLIVFVVTNELFSEHLGKHFKKLLFEKQKGNEMMLVVNKMGNESIGNCAESQAIKISEINKLIAPFNTDNLYTTFLDCNCLIDSFQETDQEEKEWLQKESGWNTLEDNLNRFIKDKGLIGRYTTALFKVEQLLVEAIAEFKSGDHCADLIKLDLVNRRGELVSTQTRIKNKIEEISSRHKTKIQQWGDEIAVELSSSDKKETVESKLNQRFKDVENEIQNMAKEFENYLNVESGKLEKRLDDFSKSELGKMAAEAVVKKLQSLNLDPKIKANMQQGAKVSKELGDFLLKHATGPNMQNGIDQILKLGGYSGSNMHGAVKLVGHAFGHKFAPWEAVKWARGLGNAGRVLGIVGAGLGFVLQLYNDNQEENAERQLIKGRSEIRSAFVDTSNSIDLEFNKNANAWVEENYGKAINEVDDRLNELDSMAVSKDEEKVKYESYLSEVRRMIALIQKS